MENQVSSSSYKQHFAGVYIFYMPQTGLKKLQQRPRIRREATRSKKHRSRGTFDAPKELFFLFEKQRSSSLEKFFLDELTRKGIDDFSK